MIHDSLPEPDGNGCASELDLESSLTIAEVGGLYLTMLEMLNGVGAIKLRAEDVDRVDGAGMQLLAALIKEAAQRRVQVHWINASAALRTAAAQLGLVSAIGLDGNG